MAIDRYHRQTLLPQIGSAGQARLGQASVLLIGCGALGSTIAELLVRAGVGKIRIADRDIVDLTNLQRQVLFDEDDARQGLPKAIAAARRLKQINSTVQIEPHVLDVDPDSIEALFQLATPQLVLDGTDNVATRYLINDACVKWNIPWVYGACVGTEGRVMTMRPGAGACLRCVFPQPPDPRELATCDTAGVLGPVACVVGAMQAAAAIKLLSGNADAVADELLTIDLWNNRIRSVSTADARRADCPACGLGRFEFLESADREQAAKLCGRNAVQVRPNGAGKHPSLDETAQRLAPAGKVSSLPFMVRCDLAEGGLSLTAFADGRVIVHGTADLARARSVVSRYLGA